MVEVKKTHAVKVINVRAFRYIDAVRKVDKRKYKVIKSIRG